MRIWLVSFCLLLSSSVSLAQSRHLICTDEFEATVPGQFKLEMADDLVQALYYSTNGATFSPISTFSVRALSQKTVGRQVEYLFEVDTCEGLLIGQMSLDFVGDFLTIRPSNGEPVVLLCR